MVRMWFHESTELNMWNGNSDASVARDAQSSAESCVGVAVLMLQQVNRNNT